MVRLKCKMGGRETPPKFTPPAELAGPRLDTKNAPKLGHPHCGALSDMLGVGRERQIKCVKVSFPLRLRQHLQSAICGVIWSGLRGWRSALRMSGFRLSMRWARRRRRAGGLQELGHS